MPAGFIDPACDRQSDEPVRLRLSTIDVLINDQGWRVPTQICQARAVLALIHLFICEEVRKMANSTPLSFTQKVKTRIGKTIRFSENKYILKPLIR